MVTVKMIDFVSKLVKFMDECMSCLADDDSSVDPRTTLALFSILETALGKGSGFISQLASHVFAISADSLHTGVAFT